MLTTLRRLSWLEKIRRLPLPSRLAKKHLAQIIEFLSLAGSGNATVALSREFPTSATKTLRQILP
jgi:hypothetical protein